MYNIRYATIDDAKILGEIHSKSWKDAYRGIVSNEILDNITPSKREIYFKKALSEKWEEDAIIFKEDVPIGLICIGKCRDDDKKELSGEIWGIYLLPQYWSMGVGSELIRWGMNELRKRSYKEITLWVLEENIRARRFYEKIGFYHDGTVKEINIGKKLKEYRYVKEIEQLKEVTFRQ
ncbi:GNAT family N-acetyltransferase [Clostridium sp. UBA4395]|uniref:GNAT family N-acetyltransferase n=1 Tax=Clostridium sp. UBA4395 TaxID=1946360 RepID=UPI003217D615